MLEIAVPRSQSYTSAENLLEERAKQTDGGCAWAWKGPVPTVFFSENLNLLQVSKVARVDSSRKTRPQRFVEQESRRELRDLCWCRDICTMFLASHKRVSRRHSFRYKDRNKRELDKVRFVCVCVIVYICV